MDFWETGYRSEQSPWSAKARDDYDDMFDNYLDNFSWEPWYQVKKHLAELDKRGTQTPVGKTQQLG